MALPIPTYYCVPHPAGYGDVSIFCAEPLGGQTHTLYAVCTQAWLSQVQKADRAIANAEPLARLEKGAEP